MIRQLYFCFILSLCLLVACVPGNRKLGGAAIGALGGAAACSGIGEGKGKMAAMAVCTLGGLIIGAAIGSHMDENDKKQVGKAMQNLPTGAQASWVDDGGVNTVTPVGDLKKENGRYCRKYRAKIIVDGSPETGEGKACKRSDGMWDI